LKLLCGESDRIERLKQNGIDFLPIILPLIKQEVQQRRNRLICSPLVEQAHQHRHWKVLELLGVSPTADEESDAFLEMPERHISFQGSQKTCEQNIEIVRHFTDFLTQVVGDGGSGPELGAASRLADFWAGLKGNSGTYPV
jgi:hypothetical protein